jgi:thymidylate synthase ThyX
MIKADIVADSQSNCGHRIISYILTYPRFIHAEIMTHRMFSRNAASSRAIPIEKMISKIEQQPAEPFYWGKNQKGMQAAEELSEEERTKALKIWHLSSKRQVKYARLLHKLGVHKQIANRLLEPFAHITTLVTATEWGNFFNLRAHPDAQPEFQELAYQMLDLYVNHEPVKKYPGEWHLPFADKYIPEGLNTNNLLKITIARAARLSYLTFEGDIDHAKDYELHDRLLSSGHWSPFEHAACCMDEDEILADWSQGRRLQGNFTGWLPYRKTFHNENQSKFDVEQLLNKRGTHNGKQKSSLEKVDRPIRPGR